MAECKSVRNAYGKTLVELGKENKDIAIIALTANAFDSDKQKSADAGCNDYMTKPIIATELLDLLNKYIG